MPRNTIPGALSPIYQSSSSSSKNSNNSDNNNTVHVGILVALTLKNLKPYLEYSTEESVKEFSKLIPSLLHKYIMEYKHEVAQGEKGEVELADLCRKIGFVWGVCPEFSTYTPQNIVYLFVECLLAFFSWSILSSKSPDGYSTTNIPNHANLLLLNSETLKLILMTWDLLHHSHFFGISWPNANYIISLFDVSLALQNYR